MASYRIPIYGSLQYPYMDIIVRENPEMDINKVIAENLSAWMESDPKLNSMKAVRKSSGIGYGTVQRAKSGSGNNTKKAWSPSRPLSRKTLSIYLRPMRRFTRIVG